MKIQTKTLIVFIVAFAASIFAGVFIYIAITQTKENAAKSVIVSGLNKEIFRRANLLDEYLLYRTESSRAQWALSGRMIDGFIGEAEKIFNKSDERKILVSIEESNKIIKQTGEQLFANFSTEPDTAKFSRKIEMQLMDQLVIARSRMIDQVNQLEIVIREKVAVLRQKLNIRVGMIVTLLFFIILADFTWIQKIIRKLAEKDAKEKAMLISIGDGMIAVDKDGRIIAMSEKTEKMIGWRFDEVKGKNLRDVVSVIDERGEIIAKEKLPMYLALTAGITTTTTYSYVRKDDTSFPVSMVVTPIFFEGKIIGAIDNFRDITKEKEIDRAKTEFVSLASHQLRTPLTAVSWYTEMILSGDVGQVVPGQKKYLEEIYYGNKRMIKLVDTLLDISRLELGTFKVNLKPTNIIALARYVLAEEKPKIEKKKLVFKENFGSDIPAFSTDPSLLRMVFQNLLDNAVEYTPEKGAIDLKVAFDSAKKNILITVSDNGYGIPQNQQDKIFTKSFRADNIRNYNTSGTGLGLYVVKTIIDQLGGKIWLKSEEGKGTEFYVSLPFK